MKKGAAYNRKKTTQKQQREAAASYHPRNLARNVGKTIGSLANQISPNQAAKNWRVYVDAAMKVPSEGKKLRKG